MTYADTADSDIAALFAHDVPDDSDDSDTNSEANLTYYERYVRPHVGLSISSGNLCET